MKETKIHRTNEQTHIHNMNRKTYKGNEYDNF